MKKSACIVAIIIVFVAVGLSVKAQDVSKRVLAGEFLSLMNVKETQEKALAMFNQMIFAQIQKMNPKSEDPAVQARLTTKMDKIMNKVRDEK